MSLLGILNLENRVPYDYSDIKELVDIIYKKYLKINKNWLRTEQKENKVMTVQLDINEGKVINSESKNNASNLKYRYYSIINNISRASIVSNTLTRDTVSSSRK